MVDIIADGYVCSDCMYMMANGEFHAEGSDACIAERTAEVAEATAGWCNAADAEHPDQDFSTAPCRTCRTRLYGARHWAVKLGD